jgi:tripartite-type tricarboxylate transporter receptor subunit TctC
VINVLARPAVKTHLDREGIETESMTPEAYTSFIHAKVAKWGPIARDVAKTK